LLGESKNTETIQSNGFTDRYNLEILVYYEVSDDIEAAIFREKQLKGGSRKKKIALIESINPDWKDLYQDLFE
jgi:putative endonuclease